MRTFFRNLRIHRECAEEREEDEDKRGKFTRLRDKMADLFGKNPAGANKSSNEVKESPRDVKKLGVEDLRKLLQKKRLRWPPRRKRRWRTEVVIGNAATS